MSTPIQPPNKNSEEVPLTSVDPEKKLKDNIATRSKLLKKVTTLDCLRYIRYPFATFSPILISVSLVTFLLWVLGASPATLIITFSLIGVTALFGLTLLFIHTACKHYEKKARKLIAPIWKEYAPRALKLVREKMDEIVYEVLNAARDKYMAYRIELFEMEAQILRMEKDKKIHSDHPLYPSIETAKKNIRNVMERIRKEQLRYFDDSFGANKIEKELKKKVPNDDIDDIIKNTQPEAINKLCLKEKEYQEKTLIAIEREKNDATKKANEILQLLEKI